MTKIIACIYLFFVRAQGWKGHYSGGDQLHWLWDRPEIQEHEQRIHSAGSLWWGAEFRGAEF